MNFSKLRDHIEKSNTIHVWKIITSGEIERYSLIFWDIQKISILLAQMERKTEKTLNTLDYDDTISSRDRSLQEWIFRDNRWQAWNDLIERTIWYDNFVRSYYERRDTVAELVQVIMSDNTNNIPFLLTAWIITLQTNKLKQTKLDKTSHSIVESQSVKPKELLRYIVEDLWYIPGKIIIYEDRPDCFLETGAFLSKLLWCEIVINHVTLSQNTFNTISNIKQVIFWK